MHALARYGLLVAAVLLPGAALAASIIDTSDASEIAAFRAGLTVEDFEDLNGLATATPTDNVIVLAGNQLSKVGSGLPDVQSLPGLHFHSGGGTFGGEPGTPVAVLDVDGSAGNLIVPLEINTDVTCVDIGCFLEIFFDTPARRAGEAAVDFLRRTLDCIVPRWRRLAAERHVRQAARSCWSVNQCSGRGVSRSRTS